MKKVRKKKKNAKRKDRKIYIHVYTHTRIYIQRERGGEEEKRRGSRGGCWQQRLLIARSNPASRATPCTLGDPIVGRPASLAPPQASATRAKASKLVHQPVE